MITYKINCRKCNKEINKKDMYLTFKHNTYLCKNCMKEFILKN